MDEPQKTTPTTPDNTSSILSDQKVGDVIGTDLSGLMDVRMGVSIELGRTKMKLQDLVKLTRGAIVELDKNAGEPLNILVNGKLIAYGEVVSINGKYGVRIIELANKTDHVE